MVLGICSLGLCILVVLGIEYFCNKKKKNQVKVLIVDEKHFGNLYKAIVETLEKMDNEDVLFVKVDNNQSKSCDGDCNKHCIGS